MKCGSGVEWDEFTGKLKRAHARGLKADPCAKAGSEQAKYEAIHAKYFPEYDIDTEEVKALGILCDLEIALINNGWNPNSSEAYKALGKASRFATGTFQTQSVYSPNLRHIYNQLKKHGLQDCMKNPHEYDHRTSKGRRKRDTELYNVWRGLGNDSEKSPIDALIQAIRKTDDNFGYPWVKTCEDVIFVLLILEWMGYPVRDFSLTDDILAEITKKSQWTYSRAVKMELSGLSPPGSFTDPDPIPGELTRKRMMCSNKHEEIPES